MEKTVLPDNTYVVGKIPGYNKNIDQDGFFQRELLKGITFVDLRPMSYVFGEAFAGEGLTKFFEAVSDAFDSSGLFKRENNISKKMFKNVLTRMRKDFSLPEGFENMEMIRIIAANDSTFTETFSNSFGGDNSIKSAVNKAADTTLGRAVQTIGKGIKSYSHAQMLNTVGKINGMNVDASRSKELATGIAAGMSLAVPTVWEGSSYTSNLSLFIKLVSPTGTDDDIQKNIIEPIMVLLAAASPVTYGGIMYGFPLLWDIHAHGITNFRLGGIGAMTLIRGSFETTFTKNLQPTVVDVRLTLVPLLNDFATQPIGSKNDIYTNTDILGVQNPGDIYRGMINTVSGSGVTPTTGSGVDTILTIKL